MNRCILSYISHFSKRYKPHGKNNLLITALCLFSISLLNGQLAPNAEFATFSGGLTGNGTFNCDEMPDFTYSITGDVAPGDTSVPGPLQTIDNNGGTFETIYGQADNAQNIEVEVAGYTGAIGDPITNQVQTTLNFNSPTPAGEFAFIIADVEQDQVMVCALDAAGNPVPVSTIAGWYQQSFDADNSDLATVAPSWDAATGTLVGQEGPGGVKQTNYQMDLPDNEAGAAWFVVDIPITQLTLKSEALGVAPDDPSQHFIFASSCENYDLALIKQTTSVGPYMPGDDVTYDITVCNQGNVTANNIEVTDYIPAGMTLSANDPNGWVATAAGATNTIATLPINTCDVIEIVLTIDPMFMGGSLVNNAEITADDGNDVDSTTGDNSQPNDFPDDDDLTETDGGDDEDPEEIMVEQVYDLALIKQIASAGPFSPGDDVTFDITVCNQGTLDAANIEITDNLPPELTLSANDANGWVGGPAGAVTNTITSLPVGMCTVVSIVTTIDAAVQSGSAINFAQITADDGDDIDSDPNVLADPGMNDFSDDDDPTETDGGDDEDPELIQIEQVYDLALIKTETSAGPYAPGDDVIYTITVVNQGTLDAGVITVSDYIPAGMTLSTADNNGWAGGPAGTVTNTVVGPTAGGAPVTIDIILTIDPNFMGTSLVNDSEITMDSGDDVDSNPGDDAHPDDLGPDDNQLTETDGGDDQDPEEIVVISQVYDLALIKQEASAGPYEPGDDVTYTITVFNQGNIDAGFIQLSDYIPAGMTLSVADNNGWAGGPVGTVTNIISGPVAGGAPVTVDIVLTIDPNITGSQDLVNNAEITIDNGDDVDSTPGDNSQPDDFPDDDDPNETDGGDDEDPETIMVCACDATADAGTMVYPGTSEGCVDDMGSTVTLTGVPTGDAVIPPGYVLSYVISVGYDLQVVDCASTPTYTSNVPGWYTFHPVVYDPNTFDPCAFAGTGTIDDLEALFASDPCICGDIDTRGTELGIYFCCMDMLQLDMNPVPPLLHDANIGLRSKGTVNMPNSTTTFTGGQFVELQRGFTVAPGSPFIAKIAPCADFGN